MMVDDAASALGTETAPGTMKAPRARAEMKRCLAFLMLLSMGSARWFCNR
jgi:hypothetical protein